MFQWTVPGSPVFEELQHLLLQPVVMQRKTGHRAGLPESHRCWEHSPSSSTCCSHTSGQRSYCAQTLKHDSFSDKHQLQTFWCPNNLLSTWTREKKKKTYTASSILPVYFALCSTTHGIQMTSYWVAGQDYFKFFICYGWILKHQS